MSKPDAAGAPRIALALAGGGPLGAVYEIGALCALEEALAGIDLTRLQHYVGISAGGFVAAALANGMGPRELCAAFIADDEAGGEVFDPAWLMVPAYGEFARRAARLPALLLSAAWSIARRRQPFTQALAGLAPAIPAGLFSGEAVHRRLEAVLSRPGRSNDFRRLRGQLTLVATDLDSGEAVAFGSPGWDHVPISRAVQASSALPGLFPPVEIDGRWFVDGALKKSMHVAAALEQGVDLVLCLNPLVPSRSRGPGAARIADGGLPAILGQTLRALIHSRLELALKQHARTHPGTDIVLIEPDPHDAALTRANALGYRRRGQLAEHAYRQTRGWLRAQAGTLAPLLARHGIRLRAEVLEDPERTLLAGAGAVARPRLGAALGELAGVLDTLERRLQGAAR